MSDENLTAETVALLVGKIAENRPSNEWLTDELEVAINHAIDVAFGELIMDETTQYEQRAIMGFMMGFNAGRDWERSLKFEESFGH